MDVLCDAADTERVAAALRAAGALPVDEAAAEIRRVESGRPRYGVDLDDGVIPQEAGLNPRAVSFTKGCYVGQETVARLFYRGKPNRHLRGLRLSGAGGLRGRPAAGRARGRPRSASVADSPVHGPIALALVRREAAPGSTRRGRRRRGDGDRRGTPLRTGVAFLPSGSSPGGVGPWQCRRTCSSSRT